MQDAVNKFTEPLSYKGSVLTYAELPSTSTNGDIYTVTSENKNYIWNGTSWEEYSSNIDLTPIEKQLKTIQTTEVAEDLSIPNTAPVNGKLDIKNGKTIQEGEPSLDNIVPIRNVGDNINELKLEDIGETTRNGITYSIKNGTITLNGTATASFNIAFGSVPQLKIGNHVFSTNAEGLETSGVFGLYLYDSNNTQIMDSGDIGANINISKQLNITSDYTNLSFTCYVGNNTIFNNVVIKPKLEKGTTATPYTPYGCGSVNILTQNANLLICDYQYIIEANANKYYKLNRMYLEANRTYYLKYNIVNDSNTNTRSTFYVLKNDKFIYQSLATNNNTKKGQKIWEFTLSESGVYEIGYWGHALDTNVTINEIILTNDKDNSYVEHQEQTVIFPLEEGQLLHQGDYLAEDGIHQVRKTVVFDGTENWGYASGRLVFYLIVNDIALESGYNSSAKSIVSSSHLQGATWYKIYNDLTLDNVISSQHEAGRIHIRLLQFTTVDELKTYLAEQYANGTPVTAEYDLEEEIVIPYTEEQKDAYYQLQHLLMYEGYTSIECIDEIKPDIQVEYSYNNEINTTYGKKIDTLEARIRQLEQMITSQSEVVA